MKFRQPQILQIANKLRQATMFATVAISLSFTPNTALAQDAQTFGDALAVPVFEQVDQNGVDLISGMLRITSPVRTSGTDAAFRVAGLQWVGKAWSIIDTPSLWKDGSNYIVNYNGRSEEFRGYQDNYAQKKPISGAKLSCSVWQPEDLTSACVYRSRDGDVVLFRGLETPYAPSFPTDGAMGYPFGNLAIRSVSVISRDRGGHQYGATLSSISGNVSIFSGLYYGRDVTYKAYSDSPYSIGFVKIITPNHHSTDDDKEHFLRPKGTIQTFEDETGAQWRYTVNSDRKITKIETPGGAADVSITYDGKVKSVITADGTWLYNYGNGTTTVTDPLGQQTLVRYDTNKDYVTEVTEVRDGVTRTTSYGYDSGDRLNRITYPELNYVTFAYDARGNVTTKITYPKPGSSVAPLIESATYPASCEPSPTCNKPLSITDAKGAMTNFEYEVGSTVSATMPGYSAPISIVTGTGKPKKITYPAPVPGAPRPEVRNTYVSGMLTESSLCASGASCVGTADEVKTTFDYGDGRMLFGKAVTANGQTLRTCYGYYNGRVNSVTPPRANLTACPHDASTTPPTSALAPAPNPRTTPTYPGVAGGGTPPGGGGDPIDPPDCGGLPCP